MYEDLTDKELEELYEHVLSQFCYVCNSMTADLVNTAQEIQKREIYKQLRPDLRILLKNKQILDSELDDDLNKRIEKILEI